MTRDVTYHPEYVQPLTAVWDPGKGLFQLPYRLYMPGQLTQAEQNQAMDVYAPKKGDVYATLGQRIIQPDMDTREVALAKLSSCCLAAPGFYSAVSEALSTDYPLLAGWILLRNRWYLESRFDNSALNKSSNAKGLCQVVPSTLQRIRDNGAYARRVESAEPIGLALDNVLAACSVGMIVFESMLGALKKHGVPPLLKDLVEGLPLLPQMLIAWQFYYHNGTSPIPYWDRSTSKASPTARAKYRDLLRGEASRVAAAYRDTVAIGDVPFIT